MGVALQHISSGIGEWAPAELTGGLKGRRASQAHESLCESSPNNAMFGAKLDGVAGCRSTSVCRNIFSPFYASKVETVEWQGFPQNAFSCKRDLFARLLTRCLAGRSDGHMGRIILRLWGLQANSQFCR